MSILIKNGYVLDMINEPQIKDVLIEGDIIKQIGTEINCDADKIIDAKGKAIIPGLINCHNHSAMAIFRGYADDLELMDWLNNKIWPIEDKMTDEDIYYSSKLSIIEMLKSGTTTFNDMYFGVENTIKAVLDTETRAIIGYAITDSEKLEEKLSHFKELHNTYRNDKLKIVLAPHAAYTCSLETLKRCAEVSKEVNEPIHIHLAETLDEDKIIKEKYGMTPTEYLEKSGIFEVPTILAHCIYLNESDREILKKYNVGISHNPISNLKLASGVAPITEYEGFNIGIGTDGSGSTNTLDMFEEMKACAYSQKVKYLKSNVINSKKVLEMATIGGSKVLMQESIGTLEEGKIADIIIVDLNKPHLQPINDLYSLLVYSANGADVDTTIINGEIVMEDRKLLKIDETECIKKCNEIIRKISK